MLTLSNFQCEKSLTRDDWIDQYHKDMMLTHQMKKMTHDETVTQGRNDIMTETVRHEHDEHRETRQFVSSIEVNFCR